MAKIYPERLPQSILDDPRRKAEVSVFHALAAMDNAFVVFYSVAWQSRSQGVARDGEADFVIAHPELGLLVMEVKGGGVSFDGESGEWYTIDRNGEQHAIKDPAEQARRSHYTLLDNLLELPGWGRGFVTIGHVACFPHISVPARPLRMDLPREIVFDRDDVDTIQQSVLRAFEHYASKDRRVPLGRERLRLVERLLARSFSIRTPLGVELEQDDEKLIELTEQQMSILQFLRTRRRAAIAGCAGSGKTMLAIEKACRLREQGFEVLLTCFNAVLAGELQQRVEGVHVTHFHGLCKEMAREHGFSLRKPTSEQEYHDIILPEQLLDAAQKAGPQYDAIIVDEGQDFRETYWIGLSTLLRENGIFYVFYDDNQNLYGGETALQGIVDEAPFPLSENCRNTRAIHQLVSQFHSQPADLVCRGPQGHAPELVYYREDAHMLRLAQAKLHQLVVEERVAPEDIVILTPRSQERTQFKIGMRLGNFVLTSGRSKAGNSIQVSSIHAFKGLERRVVLITEIDEFSRHKPEIVMYVGCSRARTYLVLFADAAAPADLKKRIESACKG